MGYTGTEVQRTLAGINYNSTRSDLRILLESVTNLREHTTAKDYKVLLLLLLFLKPSLHVLDMKQ